MGLRQIGWSGERRRGREKRGGVGSLEGVQMLCRGQITSLGTCLCIAKYCLYS